MNLTEMRTIVRRDLKDEDANTIATLTAGQAVFVVSDGAAWWDVIKA